MPERFMDKFKQNVDNTGNCVGNEYVKYQKIYYKNAVPDSRMLVFLTGFCLGMVFFYFAGIKLIGTSGLPAALLTDNIAKLQDFDFYTAGLFEYVACKRFGELLFLLICATSFLRTAFSYAVLGWGGFELGIMMFTLVYQHGLRGLLLALLLLVPHGFFYIAVFLLLFFRYWSGDKKDYHNYGAITEKGFHNKLTKVRRAMVILILWVLGILSEVYFNPEIIKKIALFFK